MSKKEQKEKYPEVWPFDVFPNFIENETKFIHTVNV